MCESGITRFHCPSILAMTAAGEIHGRPLAELPGLLVDEVVDSSEGVGVVDIPPGSLAEGADEVIQRCLLHGLGLLFVVTPHLDLEADLLPWHDTSASSRARGGGRRRLRQRRGDEAKLRVGRWGRERRRAACWGPSGFYKSLHARLQRIRHSSREGKSLWVEIDAVQNAWDRVMTWCGLLAYTIISVGDGNLESHNV